MLSDEHFCFMVWSYFGWDTAPLRTKAPEKGKKA